VKVNLADGIGIVGKLFTFFNTFLSVICAILIIYAGWLVLISGGEEEKLKKAKTTILYIILGFIVLVASHALFRFFILKG
jgi:divalent metal cation (Fe/Co/Zn/Cd) transporter